MKNVLIFGGTGFIGLNLARYLIKDKNLYSITLTSREKNNGSIKKIINFLKVENIPDNISVIQTDITDSKQVDKLVKPYDIIINLSGFSGVVNSLHHVNETIRINTLGHLNLLEAVKSYNRNAVIILASSRLEYGRPINLPVTTDHPLNPNTIYGISKYIASKYSQIYHQLYGLKTIVFRISNPFGPQLLPTSSSYNLINHFIYLSSLGFDINIFGDGEQMRDYIYIEDLCRALQISFDNKNLYGQAINLGSGRKTSLLSMAKLIIKINKKNQIKLLKVFI